MQLHQRLPHRITQQRYMAVLGPSNCSQMGRKQLYSTKEKQTANEEDHENNLAGGPHTAVGIN